MSRPSEEDRPEVYPLEPSPSSDGTSCPQRTERLIGAVLALVALVVYSPRWSVHSFSGATRISSPKTGMVPSAGPGLAPGRVDGLDQAGPEDPAPRPGRHPSGAPRLAARCRPRGGAGDRSARAAAGGGTRGVADILAGCGGCPDRSECSRRLGGEKFQRRQHTTNPDAQQYVFNVYNHAILPPLAFLPLPRNGGEGRKKWTGGTITRLNFLNKGYF